MEFEKMNREQLLDTVFELIDRLEHLEKEFEEYKEYISENYKLISQEELIG